MDGIQFPRSNKGNQYAIVFVDYLTKRPEVLAVPDQTSATIVWLLVEQIVSRHGVPTEILYDRGRSFLSALMKEVKVLLGFHKVNTAYHLQTDGLVDPDCHVDQDGAERRVIGTRDYPMFYLHTGLVVRNPRRKPYSICYMAETQSSPCLHC